MYCTKCGSKLFDGASFCTCCGAPVGGANNQSIGSAPPFKTKETPPVLRTPVPQKQGKGMVAVIVAILAAVLIISVAILLLYFLVFKKNMNEGVPFLSKDTSQPYTEETEQEIIETEDIGHPEPETVIESKVEETVESINSDTKAKKPGDTIFVGSTSDLSNTDTVADSGNEQQLSQPQETGGNNGDYIIADSNTRIISESELKGLSEWECRIARNEIYARHGRKFKDEELQSYFNAKDWYHGTIEPDRFTENMLSDVEMKNRDLIVEYEKRTFK